MSEDKVPSVNVETLKSKVAETEQESISALERLIKIGNVEIEDDICGIHIKMHTLKESEKIQALSLIKTTEGTAVSNIELSKIALLTYSITAMDSQEFITPEQKLNLFTKLHVQSQASIIDMLYDKYNDLVIKQFDIISDFKKK